MAKQKKKVEPKKPRALNAREVYFCALYVELKMNGTRAYLAAFPGTSEGAAATAAYRLVRIPKIAEEIKRITAAALKASELSTAQLVRNMSDKADFRYSELAWMPGERDMNGVEVHLLRQPTVCTQTEETTCPGPHVGTYKPLHELSDRATRMIKGVKYDSAGRKVYDLWSKDVSENHMAKFHKLLVDKVEVSGQISLADRIKAARARVGL